LEFIEEDHLLVAAGIGVQELKGGNGFEWLHLVGLILVD
jgi:hypothetical protein